METIAPAGTDTAGLAEDVPSDNVKVYLKPLLETALQQNASIPADAEYEIPVSGST